MIGRLSTGGGALHLGSDGAVSVLRSDGSPAVAGDGVGAELVLAALGRRPAAFRGAERALGVDMTNWAVVVDETWLVKVPLVWGGSERTVRQLARLAAGGSRSAGLSPRLGGLVPWELPGREAASAAIVTELVPEATDGWTWAVDDVLSWLEGEAPEPEWPAELGELVAELHAALSAEARGEVAASPSGDLRERILDALATALELVEGDTRVRWANRMPRLRALVDDAPSSPGGVRFPVHGDLHVGQFLRTTGPDGSPRYLVVDFDGDPQHPERELDIAAVDVAHLLVSVDLVGSIVQRRLGRRDERVLSWAGRARATLLEAYRSGLEARDLGRASGSPLFDERAVPALEVEQFARELAYARRYLPRWEYAPDGALSARYAPADDAQTEENPWTPPASSTT
ncbi:hypothetical protein [Herbiconiux sp. A18JL235]|uniref:GlcN kinase n=1 Tax=Herbiconiux sp. A18JL235 TaxID=3152363 RepID=A0AB39BI03_9MICO